MPFNPKKGQDAYASWLAGPGGFLGQESQNFGAGSGDYWSAWNSALQGLSPSHDQARLDAFRNNQIQTAARIGNQQALGSRWAGLGSGSQDAFRYSAGQNALNNVGNFQQMQMSPEYQMQRIAGMQGLFNPFFMNQSQGFSAARKGAHTPPGGGFLGGLLNAGAQAFGGGMFGGMGGGTQIPSSMNWLKGLGTGGGWGL